MKRPPPPSPSANKLPQREPTTAVLLPVVPLPPHLRRQEVPNEPSLTDLARQINEALFYNRPALSAFIERWRNAAR